MMSDEDRSRKVTSLARADVAVLGTGTLGAPIARNLSARMPSVRAWNRSSQRARPLASEGIDVCASVVEAVQGASVVVTMLTDGAAVAAVMEDAGGLAAMEPGAIWVQSSTVGIDATERCGRLAAEAGVLFVDAPVLGTRGPAERGELVVLASGPEDARERCRDAFEAISRETLWLGPAGAGTRLKLVVNTWLLSLVEVLAEALAFAGAMGVEAETFFTAIERGGVSLPYVRLKGSAMLREQFPPDFTLRLARKDLQLVLDAAAGARLPLAVVESAMHQFDRAIELGHGEDDYAAAYMATRRSP